MFPQQLWKQALQRTNEGLAETACQLDDQDLAKFICLLLLKAELPHRSNRQMFERHPLLPTQGLLRGLVAQVWYEKVYSRFTFSRDSSGDEIPDMDLAAAIFGRHRAEFVSPGSVWVVDEGSSRWSATPTG